MPLAFNNILNTLITTDYAVISEDKLKVILELPKPTTPNTLAMAVQLLGPPYPIKNHPQYLASLRWLLYGQHFLSHSARISSLTVNCIVHS